MNRLEKLLSVGDLGSSGKSEKERQMIHDLMQTYLKEKSRIVKAFAIQALTDIAMQDSSYVAGV